MESNFGGPIGILIAGLGLGAFYTALIWVNTLLGLFLTPLFRSEEHTSEVQSLRHLV